MALLQAAAADEPQPSVGAPRPVQAAARVDAEREGHLALLRAALPLGAVLDALTDPARPGAAGG